MNKRFAYIAALILLVFLFSANKPLHAVEVEGLYQIELPVSDQSSKQRWIAALEGFKEILVRKSGSRQVLSAYEVKQAFRKVTAYVQRYEYSNNDSADAKQPYTLLLDYAPRLIDELIQESGMPIWGSNRPVTILWLATEQALNRTIVTESEELDSFSTLLKDNAKRRGIPVILPLMDLEDELSVTLSDVWGRFNSTVVAASQRYAADSVVVGRINQVGEEWQARLSYINQGEEATFEFTAPDKNLAVKTMTDRLTELLCQKYCVVETVESNQIKIQVSNIGNFSNFKRAQSYLNELSSVRKVDVDKISTTHVRFNVSLLGDLQSIKDGISLGTNLIEEDAPAVDPFQKISPLDALSTPLSGLLANNNSAESTGVAEQSNQVDIENPSEQLEPLTTTGELGEDAAQSQNSGEFSSIDSIDTLNEEVIPKVTLYYRWSR